MDDKGYFINSDWLCMIGPYRNNQQFMLIKWVCAGLIIISINGHSKWIQKNTYLKALTPACHSLPISTLNLMHPTLRIGGAQPDMVQRHPRGRFRILDEEATRWESDPGMRTWDEFGFKGEETVLAAASPIPERSTKWPMRRSAWPSLVGVVCYRDWRRNVQVWSVMASFYRGGNTARGRWSWFNTRYPRSGLWVSSWDFLGLAPRVIPKRANWQMSQSLISNWDESAEWLEPEASTHVRKTSSLGHWERNEMGYRLVRV